VTSGSKKALETTRPEGEKGKWRDKKPNVALKD